MLYQNSKRIFLLVLLFAFTKYCKSMNLSAQVLPTHVYSSNDPLILKQIGKATMGDKNHIPLHYAVFFNKLDTLKYYIETKGFNINAVDDNGLTALDYARARKNVEIRNYLQNVQLYLDSLTKVTPYDKDQDGNYFDAKSIPDYQALDSFPAFAKRKKRFVKAQRYKKTFEKTSDVQFGFN